MSLMSQRNSVTFDGPTADMRNLASKLMVSGSNTIREPSSINEALVKKNTELQASVTQSLIMRQKLQQKSELIKQQGYDATFITGQ